MGIELDGEIWLLMNEPVGVPYREKKCTAMTELKARTTARNGSTIKWKESVEDV